MKKIFLKSLTLIGTLSTMGVFGTIISTSCSHSGTVTQAVPDDGIKTKDGKVFDIDVTKDDFLTKHNASGPFTFTDKNGVQQSVDRKEITEFSLLDLPPVVNDTIPNDYLYDMCYGFVNLNKIEIKLPEGIKEIGNNFGRDMFNNCYSLKVLPSDFTLPSTIEKVGNNFCSGMFYGCTALESLPYNFVLPQGLKEVGNSCFQFMFGICSALSSLPGDETLIIPNPTLKGTNYCERMFDRSAITNTTPKANDSIPIKRS